jgi:hypothetical protein
MANISNIVNVALLPEGSAAATDNMNVVAIITSNQDGPINSAKRYELYTDSASVANDFGSASDISAFASTFFGTKPNPVNAGGVLVVGYWRGASETVPASSGVLRGAQIDEVNVLAILQQIEDGAFNITVDGDAEVINGLDFRTATTMAEAVALINAELTQATATYDDMRVIITSDTTGATSVIDTFATDPGGSTTFIGELLNIASGTGAAITAGAAQVVLTAETQLAAITAIKAAVNIKGAVFINGATDEVREDLAEWSSANSVLIYDVFSNAANLEIATTNIVWQIKLAGHKNYRMLYSKTGNRRFAASYMARAHVVNFNAENSALTMHLKELAVPAEDYTQTEISKAKAVGLDIYTTVKDVPIVLTSGANDFMDNQYNLIAFIDAVQVGQFNVLKLTPTKVSQTTPGVNKLVDQAEKDARRFVRAGVFAPGVWSNPDTFGDFDTFNRSIEQFGFYVLAGLLRDQPQPDRQARKSPVLQIAVKNAGAIHSVDVIINFNA